MNLTVAFLIVLIVLTVGEIVSMKTKAFIPSVFVSAAIFLAGFWTFFPENIVDLAGFTAPVVTLAMLTLVGHMGTMLSFKEMVSQWKTVAVALGGIAGICLGTLTLGKMVFGWDMAVITTPPLTGGLVAAIIMSEAAKAKGLEAFAVLAIIVYVMQGFAGYPLTSIMLKKEGQRLLGKYRASTNERKGERVEEQKEEVSKFRLFAPMDKKYQTTYMLYTKLGVLMVMAHYIDVFTGGAVSKYIVMLILGTVAAEIGFIERQPLTLANSFGFFMTALMAFIFASLSKATPAMLGQLIVPLIGIIIFGVIGMAIISIAVGKLLGYTKEMAFSVALTALYGFPPNYILTQEAVKALTEDEQEREFLMGEMLPKMLIGGFTTVTIVSVVIAGVFKNLL